MRRALFWSALFLLRSSPSVFAFDISYWAWQRTDPLTETELRELAAQNVRTVYWHIGELENTGERWTWKAHFPLPNGTTNAPRFVPVVRLVSHEQQPFSPGSTAALVSALSESGKRPGELQLDYDAPDRLLDDYGRALSKIRELDLHLSITALPHWSQTNCLKSLAGSVDEVFPMLYDFEPEPFVHDGRPQPIIDPVKMAKMLGEWSRSNTPWHAGLPVFARLTLYDANGKSRGQIRNWNWDELSFNRALLPVSKPLFGATLLRAQTPLSLSTAHLQAGDQVAVRLTDRKVLHDAIDRVRKTNATGVTLFRLPDSSASSGWSIEQLSHLDATPRLVLRRSPSSDSLVLRNESLADLEPFLPTGQGDIRGYQIQVAADRPIFREAEAGDFEAVIGYAEEGGGGVKRVAIPFATQLTFTLSHLRAGQSLKTGLIQLAPGSSFHQSRYRFKNSEDGWKPLE